MIAHRACPVCGNAEPTVLFRQDFAAVEMATPVTGYDVAVCQSCGAGYADGIPDQRAFDRYYRNMSKYEYHQREGAESEYDQRRLAAPYHVSPQMTGYEALDEYGSWRTVANYGTVWYPRSVPLGWTLSSPSRDSGRDLAPGA